MQIDARKLGEQELLARLKEIFSSSRECGDIALEILVNTEAEANRIKAFASMSGCRAGIDKKGDFIIIHLKGNPCCS